MKIQRTRLDIIETLLAQLLAKNSPENQMKEARSSHASPPSKQQPRDTTSEGTHQY